MKKYLVLILLVVCVTGFSQTQPLPPLPPYVEVTGSAEMFVKPDVYYINLRIVPELFSSYTGQEKRIGSELSKVGIQAADISLAAVGFDWQKQGIQPNDRVQYQDYVLRIQTEKELIDIFTALQKARVDRSYVASVDFTKKEQIISQLSVLALKNAEGKATAIVATTGGRFGKPMAIVEEFSGAVMVDNNPPAWYNTQQNNNYDRPMFTKNYESIPYKVSYRITYSIL